MGFTTPCFIRKSTYKLMDKLNGLGYRLFGCELNEDLCIFTEPECGLYSVEFFSNITHPDEADSIDCGTNDKPVGFIPGGDSFVFIKISTSW